MSSQLLTVSQLDFLIQDADTNLHTELKTEQVQISRLFQRLTDLDLHCLQRQGILGFRRTRFKVFWPQNNKTSFVSFDTKNKLNYGRNNKETWRHSLKLIKLLLGHSSR